MFKEIDWTRSEILRRMFKTALKNSPKYNPSDEIAAKHAGDLGAYYAEFVTV